MLKNILEDVVLSMVDRVIADENVCGCERCKMDICAIALNNLKPRYVVTQEGSVFTTMGCYTSQNKVEIYAAILKGIHQVQASPRHPQN